MVYKRFKDREIIEVKKNTSEDEILKIINSNEKLSNYINNNQIIKKIFVPNKIINLIIK